MNKFQANFFQAPNYIIDELMNKMSSSAFKCYMVIIRQTVGWQKLSDEISISQFVEKTGNSKNTILKACKELEELNLIKKTKGCVNKFSVILSPEVGQKKETKPTEASPKKTKETPKSIKNEDYQQVIDKIVELGKTIPQPTVISKPRKQAIKSCINDFGIEKVLQMLNKASKSPLTNRGWFNFDFMWKNTQRSNNFLKILEGAYDFEFEEKKDNKPVTERIIQGDEDLADFPNRIKF